MRAIPGRDSLCCWGSTPDRWWLGWRRISWQCSWKKLRWHSRCKLLPMSLSVLRSEFRWISCSWRSRSERHLRWLPAQDSLCWNTDGDYVNVTKTAAETADIIYCKLFVVTLFRGRGRRLSDRSICSWSRGPLRCSHLRFLSTNRWRLCRLSFGCECRPCSGSSSVRITSRHESWRWHSGRQRSGTSCCSPKSGLSQTRCSISGSKSTADWIQSIETERN